MVRFEAFDSPEGMFERLAEMNRQGHEMMKARGLTGADLEPGTYWMCLSEPGLIIIGRAEDSPYEEDMRGIREARENGYIYGNWYSVVMPEGEWGSNHFSWCVSMTEEAFLTWMQYIRQEADMTEGEPRWKSYTTCPRCGGPMPRSGAEGQYPGALSRRDNWTYICSDCGTQEALEDLSGLGEAAWTGPIYWDEEKTGRTTLE